MTLLLLLLLRFNVFERFEDPGLGKGGGCRLGSLPFLQHLEEAAAGFAARVLRGE